VPFGVTATVTGSTVVIRWNAPPAGGRGYILEAGTMPGGTNAARFATGLTYVVANAVPAGVYYVRVRAQQGAGVSAASEELAVRVGISGDCAAAPANPSNLAAATQGLNVHVTWAASAGCSPTHYLLLAGSAPGASNLAQVAVPGQSLGATASAGTYYVRVLAVNAFGASAPSNEITVTLHP
jgi:chitinase